MDKEIDLTELNKFLGEAALATYAGGGVNLDPEKALKGMKEIDYSRGDWSYKDSYAGFFQSFGREVIWFNGKPVWCQNYGGGMIKKYHNDSEFAHRTFDFLKKAMSAGNKKTLFQPRGLNNFKDGDWKYKVNLQGDITKFNGNEEITFKGEVVFTHEFNGGLFLWRNKSKQ